MPMQIVQALKPDDNPRRFHFVRDVGYVKNIVWKTPATSLDDLSLRIVAAIETVTPQMLENTWRETE
jgi:hypothetical protein